MNAYYLKSSFVISFYLIFFQGADLGGTPKLMIMEPEIFLEKTFILVSYFYSQFTSTKLFFFQKLKSNI